MEDQFSLNYVKDGIMYPIALTGQQNAVLQNVVPNLVAGNESLKVITDKPIGEAVLLCKKPANKSTK